MLERTEGPDGKGAVLRWFLEGHALEPDEALVVIDADNRVPVNLLERLSDEIDGGGQVLQAYLDVSNPDASALATASALSYWASNRMVQLARHNLGWTADLGGTGMCISAAALADAGGFGDSLVEDQELGVRLFLAGHKVQWLHDVRIADEKPAGADVAIRQRSRWVAGRRQCRPAVLWEDCSNVATRLPGTSPSGWSSLRGWELPSSAQVWRWLRPSEPRSGHGGFGLGVGLIQLLAPDPVSGQGSSARPLPASDIRYLVLLPLLKMPARLMKNSGWYHTPHEGSDRS